MSKESVHETQLLWLVERAEAILAEQGVPKAVCCAAEGSGLRSPSLLYVVALEGRRFPLPSRQGGSFAFRPSGTYLSYFVFSFSFYI